VSNEDSFPETPLSDNERIDVRRYCWYPVYGPGAAGFNGWRFFQAYGFLEYRLTNMAGGELQALRFMLTNLYALESAITAASPGLNVESASVFTRNPRELPERKRLYDYTRKELCNFMGVPPGPMAGSGNAIVI
jgi:hypothetical protein